MTLQTAYVHAESTLVTEPCLLYHYICFTTHLLTSRAPVSDSPQLHLHLSVTHSTSVHSITIWLSKFPNYFKPVILYEDTVETTKKNQTSFLSARTHLTPGISITCVKMTPVFPRWTLLSSLGVPLRTPTDGRNGVHWSIQLISSRTSPQKFVTTRRLLGHPIEWLLNLT